MPTTSLHVTAVLVVSLLCSVALPARAVDVAFSADVSARSAAVGGAVFDSFGSSHGSTTLRAKWREHFATTQRDIPFSRVRFHGILDDDMSTLLDGQANGALVFDTLDFLVAQRITPTIEISFMPEQLASNPALTVFHYKGGASPPSSFARWQTFITQFARLLIDRYGIAVVGEWLFEVWNEPNCGFYYTVGCCGQGCGNQTAYFQLYAATAAALKAADTRLLVGGPSTAQLGWIPEFLRAARTAGAPVDFVSSHLYPTDDARATRESFMDDVENSTALAHAEGVPFLLTEFNAGLGSPAGRAVPLLDSSYAAAFVLHAHLRAQAIAGLLSMSYWTFTDFGFEEGGVDPLPWNPGASKFGIQTMYGVKKPVYRAFQFLSDWRAGLAVPVKPAAGGATYTNTAGAVIGAMVGAVDALVAVADGGVVTALLGNFDIASASSPPPPAANVTLTISGFGARLPTNATLELIDDAHANPLATWRAAGSPKWPTADEIAAEAATSVVIAITVPVEAVGSGVVRLSVTLPPYAVARVRLVAPSAVRERTRRSAHGLFAGKRNVHG